jgi:hypothetical protein
VKGFRRGTASISGLATVAVLILMAPAAAAAPPVRTTTDGGAAHCAKRGDWPATTSRGPSTRRQIAASGPSM